MEYPNNIKKKYQPQINYKNRGMDLEEIINDANRYYLEQDLAVVYKKPTPIKLVEVDYKHLCITKAYFKEPSTLDYNGLVNGNYIEFDAKECHSKTSFPFNNISNHQIEHIKKVLKHGGIAFLIISMNQNYYLLKGEDLIELIKKSERKSIPFTYLEKNGIKMKYSYQIGLDYLKAVKEAYKGVEIQ